LNSDALNTRSFMIFMITGKYGHLTRHCCGIVEVWAVFDDLIRNT
jgi:hypothetical protein